MRSPVLSHWTQQPIRILGRALKVSRPVDNRLFRYFTARASRWSDAVRRALPGPVKAVLIRFRAAAFKRRRSVIVLVVLVQHAAVLLLLAAIPPKPVPVSPIAMDVTLFRLDGAPSPTDRVPTPDPGGTDRKAPEPTSDETERPEPAEPEPSQPTSEAADDAPPAPLVEADASSLSSEEASRDVLAIVEQITASDVETIAQAAPAGDTRHQRATAGASGGHQARRWRLFDRAACAGEPSRRRRRAGRACLGPARPVVNFLRHPAMGRRLGSARNG